MKERTRMSTWLITGCSTGLGRALARAVLDRGDNAVVTARDVATVRDLADAHPDTALALALDVTDGAQVTRAVRAAEERFGGVDVLVNNAGATGPPSRKATTPMSSGCSPPTSSARWR
jgi:NAD(P)-dependent dehydrogenase (short-subunit alcohol dehydrogenase family)